MTDTVLGWHFVGDTLRDGRPTPPDGEWLVHGRRIAPGRLGLHASVRILDALCYAPGNTVCRVEMRGDIQRHDGNKIVGRERRILWRIDGTKLLREFARRCALDVAHLWDMPSVVRDYLETGNETIRAAARGVAVMADAWAAAMAAKGGAHAAASAAARAAVWAITAASAARGDAAWGVAWAAAWAAARDAANDAAWDAAWDAARDAQNTRLTEMVEAAHEAELAKESEQ